MSLGHMALTFPKCPVSLGIEAIILMLVLNDTYLGSNDTIFFFNTHKVLSVWKR